MAHESFDDPEVARVLNESFISIKIDREEMPELDDALMTAVQLYSGRGGWPMSLLATSEVKPFFAGTYFPRDHFLGIVQRVSELWQSEREKLQNAADQLQLGVNQVRERRVEPSQESNLIGNVIEAMAHEFDRGHGGFGSAPKFPPHAGLNLLYLAECWPRLPLGIRRMAREMRDQTVRGMVLGAIHDHVGGGFHRYSTTADWGLPHFEKMLYDNALLLEAMPIGEEGGYGARGIVRWIQEEMTAPDGTFYSAIDADSPQGEGWFYTWTLDELFNVDPSGGIAEWLSATKEGTFREEASGEATGRNLIAIREVPGERESYWLDVLRAQRCLRERPQKDEKRIASWNALAITALALKSQKDMATRCAEVWREAMGESDRLPRYLYAEEQVGEAGLEDIAAMAIAFFNVGFREEGQRLVDRLLREFRDSSGAFVAAPEGLDGLYVPAIPVFDQPIPSGNALAIQACAMAERLEEAERALRAVSGWMERVPTATEGLAHAQLLLEYEKRPVRIDWTASKRVARFGTCPGFHIQSVDGVEGDSVTVPPGVDELKVSVVVCNDRECLPPVDFFIGPS